MISLVDYHDGLTRVIVADYTVQIDTGSSDLWVFSQDTLPIMTPSKAYADVSYVDGSSGTLPYQLLLMNIGEPLMSRLTGVYTASGPVAFAEFSIGSYSVESQGKFLCSTVSDGLHLQF